MEYLICFTLDTLLIYKQLRPWQRLQHHLGAQQGWLTLGSNGSLGIQANGDQEITPAMTQQVKDTTGAGDAFFALASLSTKLDLDLRLGSFLGNLAGALAANVLGNEKPIEKGRLLKFAKTIFYLSPDKPSNDWSLSTDLYTSMSEPANRLIDMFA